MNKSQLENSTLLYVGSESDYSLYNCKYCLYGTNTIESLRKHERSHSLSAPPVRKELKPLYNCEFCSTKFVQKKELEEHRKTHVVGMSCSLCSYTSPNKNNLKNHVRAHCNRRSFQCLLCCERMTSRKMLDDHINKHVLTLSSCKWCRFTTDTPSRLKAHFQIHMKTKQINCESCDYFCFVASDMEVHRKLHEGEEAKKEALKEDAKKASEETPGEKASVGKTPEEKAPEEKNPPQQQPRVDPFHSLDLKKLLKRAFFKCSICGQVVKSDEALKRHSYQHILAQRYSCHICSFTAQDREEIMNHVIDHLPVVDLSTLGQ